MIIEIIQFILGIAFALFLPGFLIVEIFFEEFKLLEKVAFSIAFSIMADIAIGIFLGYDEAQALWTGGLNLINIIYCEIALFAILVILLGVKLILKKKNVYNKNHLAHKK